MIEIEVRLCNATVRNLVKASLCVWLLIGLVDARFGMYVRHTLGSGWVVEDVRIASEKPLSRVPLIVDAGRTVSHSSYGV